MIQFVMEGKKVRFEVNLTATQHAGLTLSSELLKVATAVRKDSREIDTYAQISEIIRSLRNSPG